MRMRTGKKLMTGAAVVALSALALMPHEAQAVSTVSVNIEARIVSGLAITASRTMNFGVLTFASSGTATLNDTDAISGTTGGVSTSGGTVSSGGISAYNGTPGATVAITVPAGNVSITCTGATAFSCTSPGDKMIVNNFTCDGNAVNTCSRTLHATLGSATGIGIGARLNVSAGQSIGVYTGTFSVTVNQI